MNWMLKKMLSGWMVMLFVVRWTLRGELYLGVTGIKCSIRDILSWDNIRQSGKGTK